MTKDPSAFSLDVIAGESGLAVFGNIPLDERRGPVSYLAVGSPPALRRVPIEHRGLPCTGTLTSVAIVPDGSYWLVLDGDLLHLDPDEGLRYQAPPLVDLESLDLSEWAWSSRGRWRHRAAPTMPAAPSQWRAVGVWWAESELWLHASINDGRGDETIDAVLKSGSHPSVAVLPRPDAVLGTLARLQHGWVELRLLTWSSGAELRRFEREVMPRLRARSELLQLYESRHDGVGEIVAVIDPEQWRAEMQDDYAKLLGERPALLDEPLPITRMLIDR